MLSINTGTTTSHSYVVSLGGKINPFSNLPHAQ